MTYIKPTSTAPFSIAHENMMRSVVGNATAPENLNTTNSIPAFATLINTVVSNLTTIDTLRASIGSPITGYAATNKAVKMQLAVAGATAMKAAYAYALNQGDEYLAAAFKTSKSQLYQMKNVDTFAKSQAAINLISPLVSALIEYNINSTTIEAWQTLCTQFGTLISTPKISIAQREAVNKQIQSLLRDNMVMLITEADELAFQFCANNLPYYNAYRACRRINAIHRSTQLRLHVLNQSGQPVTQGEVFIISTDRSAPLDLTGYALVNQIPFGTHTFSLTTPFGTNTYGPFDFKKGKSLTLHVQVSNTAPATIKVTEEDLVEETFEVPSTKATKKK